MQNDNACARKWPEPLIPALLILLFTYAALSKILAFGSFEAGMLVQPFPRPMAFVLAFILPPIELVTAALLSFKTTRLSGLWLSFILMVLFTGYAALAYFHFWASVPCPCGGILGSMSWGPHLFFNTFFLLVTITSIFINNGERRTGGPEKTS